MSESSSPLSEQQRGVLADRLFQAAVANTDRATDQLDSRAAESFALAAHSLALAFVSVSTARDERHSDA